MKTDLITFDGEAETLARELLDQFTIFVGVSDQDPTANPLLRLALEIAARLETGALDYAKIERLVQFLTVRGFQRRAERLGRYSGETDLDRNIETLRDIIRKQTRNAAGETRPFEEFRAWVERGLFGIVITAHPTFEISADLMRSLSALAIKRKDGQPLDLPGYDAILADVAGAPHRPEKSLTLKREQELALEAIANIQTALRRAYRLVLDVAAETYPDDWSSLTPRLITVASWVGFDTDGRTDIGWTQAFERRLETAAAQLDYIASAVAELRGGTDGNDLKIILDLMASRVARAIGDAESERDALFGYDPAAPASATAFKRVARRMYDGKDDRLDSAAPLVKLLDHAIGLAGTDRQLIRDMLVLRAELANFGLGISHIHARINATQLHNAIRQAVDLDASPDDPRHRQSYLARITELIADVRPVTINFGSLIGERTSSKRLLMTMAQILKYVDSSTRIRLLIAECESPFTVLTALYYAKLFGIDDRVEICPLFETERALQQGSRVIEQLLDNPAYAAYLKTIGRICIQTGYSDAGRYIGQTPASGSIERMKERVVKLVERRALPDVQLVFFDTHGESIGRGGHPEGFRQRLDYVASPALMSAIADSGVPFKQETSFQGGDGYLYFQSEASAFAALTRILEWSVADRSGARDDIYYEDRDTVTEFMTTVKEFQNGLIADPNYGLLIGTYGVNLLYTTGSRATRREGESIEAAPRPQISEFRAIPHNAVLQQLGLLANSISGVGEAIEQNPAWFQQVHAESPRLRQMISLVGYGVAVSNPDALAGYVQTIDPGLWLSRAASAKDASMASSCRRVAEMLEEWDISDGQRKIYRKLYSDFILLRGGLETVAQTTGAQIGGEAKRALTLLHAIRIALIHEIYLFATRIPQFSSRHEIANRRIFQRVLQLDIPAAVAMLRRIFPAMPDAAAQTEFGEPATYVGDATQTYQRENDQIFTPMLNLYDLIPRISIAVIHHIGALG
jgi:phosphoenolpyruvate carboxylase